MKCSNCGTKNPKKFKFCKECGEELAVVAAAPAPAAQPAVVIIKEEHRRRGVPALIWILVGMILVVLLCGLLVWLDFVDVPEQVRVRLPDPIGDLVDAVDDARPPGAPDLPGGVAQDDEPGQQWEPPQDPPGNQGQPQQPSQPQEPASSYDPCDEDLWDKCDCAINTRSDYYSGREYITISFSEPLDADRYDMRIETASGYQPVEVCDVSDGDLGPDLCKNNGPFEWPAGEMWIVFFPEGESCVVGRWPLSFDCKSGEAWHPNWPYGNPTGCCTVGCWCNHPSTGQPGCWQECAPACAE